MHRYRIDNLRLELDEADGRLEGRIRRRLGRHAGALAEWRLARRSLDARRKRDIHFRCTVECLLRQRLPEPLPAGVRPLDASLIEPERPDSLPRAAGSPPGSDARRAVVVGAGPAGLFASLALAEAGLRVTLLERGRPVERRMRDIGRLRSRGELDPESNICFGEGGAGTYTDGKLYTRIKHPYVRWVLAEFVRFGASPDILIDAHPHLGTDRLVRIVRNMRGHLLGLGVDYRFETRVERLLTGDGRVRGVVSARGKTFAADAVVLATGHSARDIYAMLREAGIPMQAKAFAVGVRAEHPQTLIDRIQFGRLAGHPRLGAAEYRLTHQAADARLGRRGVYSFCMCPGGLIVPSPTEAGRMAVNGMSNAKRASPWANSGLVVQIDPYDLGATDDPMAGIEFQRRLEEAAFAAGGDGFRAPAMRVADFVARRATGMLAPCRFKPGVVAADLWEVLPEWVAAPLADGIRAFDRRMRGYLTNEANLLGSETRTSSPVRIARGDDLQSPALAGLYPVGEGAGFAGGIVSAAVDGLRAAAAIIARA